MMQGSRFSKRPGSNASSLLQKASLQLQGKKAPRQPIQHKDDDEDDLEEYFSALKNKASAGPVTDVGHDELTINDSPISQTKLPASKFLKKPATPVNKPSSEIKQKSDGAEVTTVKSSVHKSSAPSLERGGWGRVSSDIDTDVSLGDSDIQPRHTGGMSGNKKLFSMLPSAERFASRPLMDTDEESLAEYIGDLSSSSSHPVAYRPPTRTQSVSPLTPRANTIDDISEEDDSVSSAGSFRVAFLDMDNLEPATKPLTKPGNKGATHKPARKNKPTATTTVPDDLFGLQSVDDLLGGHYTDDDAGMMVMSVQSEVPTEEIVTDSDVDLVSRRSTPLRSILSPSPRQTPRSSRSRVRLDLTDVQEVTSPDEASDRHVTSTIHTDLDSSLSSHRRSSDAYYSDDFMSASESYEGVRRYSRNMSMESVTSYSDDFSSVTDATSEHSRSPSPEIKRRTATCARQVQTGPDIGMQYSWLPGVSGTAASLPVYGLQFVDPTPIATHVVSADALEAMTAYSPCVLALNDMLRQQLQLTSQLIETNNRHVTQVRGALNSVHSTDTPYTTLHDYKQFVSKHKKHTITFDQAIKEVKMEMGMTN